MPFRPPPEQVVEFMVKSMGSKFVMRDTLKEMRAYRDDTKKRIELLQTESDELRLRLEKYCTIYTPYEALDPEDFAHLASTQPDQPPFISPMDFIFPPEMRAISPILGPGEGDEEEEEDGEQDKFETITDVVVELVARNRAAAASQQAGQEQLPTEPLPTPPPQNNAEEVVAKPDGELEESEPGGKKLQQSLDEASAMIRRQVLISAQEKYGQMAVIERDDLDIEGLLQHFKALGPNMFASIKSSKMKLTSAKSRNLDDCANLPLVEIPMTSEDRMRGQMEGMLQAGGASEPKMPPFVLTQMRKYTQGTTIFREPQGQIIKSGE
ncbi:uncharacterized protein LOC118436248 [Folsomia candida]|nr:uncharacterized protein LOC118436248 [Folsomia candida]